ncbi:MAG: MarR family winged helix-turn-helix transcriptional regulator [Maritimibacter harenae]|jgi:DNA-binding MarR family transcriptional regulator|uniref:MarR family transcriptional regulator n=1 Tax=Maritimibacter harenae TaxID=2606218 RepID=A0A845MAB7_9RHOB|nr:MarR family transcriptional regulator [Maritimibacter harenae]MZR13611.1 MarR family transcriptional regulator [Maritimibacter harenae]
MDRTDISLIALRRILRATELYGKELATAAKLTAAQFRALQIVAETGRATPKDIASRMGVSQATITALVDKLVARRLVTRERSERDRRQTNVTVTPEGQATVDEAPDALQQRYVRKFEALEDWEQAQIIASLERVAAMLDADAIDASPVLTTGDIKSTDKRH